MGANIVYLLPAFGMDYLLSRKGNFGNGGKRHPGAYGSYQPGSGRGYVCAKLRPIPHWDVQI